MVTKNHMPLTYLMGGRKKREKESAAWKPMVLGKCAILIFYHLKQAVARLLA